MRSIPFELTVPGGRTVPADGITTVTVAPTHRRRGLLSGMMREAMAAAAGRGDAVSVLIASEWRIYGRYGFAPGTEAAEWTVDTLRAGAPVPRPAGSRWTPPLPKRPAPGPPSRPTWVCR